MNTNGAVSDNFANTLSYMLLVEQRVHFFLFLEAFWIGTALVNSWAKPGVAFLRSPDVLIYSRIKPAQGWIHEWSAAFTLTNTLSISVGFLKAARRQLHPETQ